MRSVLEKQIVQRTTRLIRVRRLMCLLSIRFSKTERMHGNVLEWVQDWYGSDYYQQSPGTDPQGPEGPREGWRRVRRGGSFGLDRRLVRCAYRYGADPRHWGDYIGVRVVLLP